MARDICVYCALPKLTGSEDPEHVLPAAVNGRLVIKAACNPCNRWVGSNVDQPWLNELFVLSARYQHQIADRNGNVLDYDPLLAGATADGTRLRIGRDGQPVALNSPVLRDAQTGEVQIHAKDEEDLQRLTAREVQKATAAGKSASFGEAEWRSSQPTVTISHRVVPGRWERMAAKIMLGLLAETQPATWRLSKSADELRQRMHDEPRTATEVPLRSADAFHEWAPAPASAAAVICDGNERLACVSLMGVFAVKLDLADDLAGLDLAWVSDPLEPARSALGERSHVVAKRLGLL